jgi:hypothetical protein
MILSSVVTCQILSPVPTQPCAPASTLTFLSSVPGTDFRAARGAVCHSHSHCAADCDEHVPESVMKDAQLQLRENPKIY